MCFPVTIRTNIPFNISTDPRTAATSKTEADVRNTYGLALKNPDYTSKKHILNQTVIRAGETVNLRGDDAQVAVRQLVNEIMQQRGLKTFLSDPTRRKQIEDEVIVGRGSIEDLMDNRLQNQQTVINEAINKSNEVKNEEAAFPGLNTSEESGAETAGNSDSDPTGKSSPAKKAS